ncbi:MAG: 23S rRNA pseudouridine2605 synthase [Candidatus Paceibacteria bacterium]|jgi:23S rRNA pseudouridine2605 synthase
MAYLGRKKTTTRGRGGNFKKKASRGSAGGAKRVVKKATRQPRKVESVSEGIRLNKLLAEHGLASRRGADEMIAEGKVFVEGVQIFELGLRVDPQTQLIEINGEKLEPKTKERKQYYLLNKPAGVVCTNERRETRPRAIDLINDRAKGRIYTVGRLDEESKGLIILTNDGEFANHVMHPRYGVSKTYMVKLKGSISDPDVQRVREGVYLADGKIGHSRVLIKRRTRESSMLEVTLHEGKNREIRRVFLSVGFKVMDLRRTMIGPILDKKLKIGYWRHLTPVEVKLLLEPPAEGPEPATARSRKSAPRRSGARGRGRR